MTYDEAGKILPAVYETVRRDARGHGHAARVLVAAGVLAHDPSRQGALRRRARRRARPRRRFVAYEISGEWTRGFSNRTLTVFDIQSTNAAARAALWQYLFGVDLVVTVSADRLPIDEPLRLLLATRVVRGVDFVGDDMWLAPLDARALLEARRYSVFDGHLVIEVTDLGGRAVRFAVEGNEQAAQCTVTDAAPDVVVFDRDARCPAARREPLDAVRGGRPRAGARSRPARLCRRDVRSRRRRPRRRRASSRTGPSFSEREQVLLRVVEEGHPLLAAGPRPNGPASSRWMRCGASTNETPAAVSAVVVASMSSTAR